LAFTGLITRNPGGGSLTAWSHHCVGGRQRRGVGIRGYGCGLQDKRLICPQFSEYLLEEPLAHRRFELESVDARDRLPGVGQLLETEDFDLLLQLQAGERRAVLIRVEGAGDLQVQGRTLVK